MSITWTTHPRGHGEPAIYQSELLDVVRGTGHIRIDPASKLVGKKYKPVMFDKDFGFTVGFYVASGHEGAHASISGPLRLSAAKRAAELWLEGRVFATDDGRIVAAYDKTEKRLMASTTAAIKYRKKPGADVKLPKTKRIVLGRLV